MDNADWQDFYKEKKQLPPVSIPQEILKQLAEFVQNAMDKEDKHMSITTEVLDNLYQEVGNDDIAASLIISYIQRRHSWDVELLAERRDIDEILYRRHNLYDDHMWDKVMNTTAISDLHHETYKLSQKYIARAIKEVLVKDGTVDQPPF